MSENTFVGKFIKGKEVVETSSDSKFVNFFFADGTYEVAPIIDGVVKQEFDEVEEVVDEAEAEEDEEEIEEFNGELGFYKVLQPIPFTDEYGAEIGMTEVDSIQEVPVDLGDSWVELGLAVKVDEPKQEGIISNIINAVTGNK